MTRTPRRRTLLALSLLPALACACEAEHDAVVSMFRGDAAHTGVFSAPGLEAVSGLRWIFQADGPIRSSPTVAGGRVYIGSADGRLYALDALMGAEAWRYDAGSAIPSTAAVGGGHVFFQDRDGVVYALDAASGAEVWRFATGPDMDLPWGNEGWDYFISSPALAGDTVLVGAGDGKLYALSAATGSVLWEYATEGRIRSSPAVADGVVYVGSADGSLHAVELTTGERVWRFDAEGRSLVSADFGFDRRTITSSPAVGPEAVYVGSRDGHLYAVDRATGEERWRFDHEVSWVISSPAIADGVVYAGSSDGLFVQAVDAASGAELWRTPTELNVFASPALVNGTLYVGTFTGAILGLDPATGEEVWRYRAEDAVMSSAVAADSTLYVGSDDGRLYAFRGVARERAPDRVVFWDSALARTALYNGHEALRDYMAGAGYRVVDADGLARFMEDGLASGRPGIAVFAIDRLPASVAPVMADTVLFRRWLSGPGRAVWLGYPPGALLWDPETGRPTALSPRRTEALLGVSTLSATYDSYPARATAEGRAWGLPEWWIDRAGVDPADVTTVLATEERGRAVAWLKSYGGIPGSGFVRLWARRDPIPDPGIVLRVAESGWR